MKFFAGAVLALGAFFTAGCAIVPGVSPRVPLRGDEERALRRADALGLVPTASLSSFPLSESDVAWTIQENIDALPQVDPDESASAADIAWFREFAAKEAPVIDDVVDPHSRDATFLAPIDDARLRYTWVDGPVRIENERGRDFEDGSNLYASDRVVLRVADLFLFSLEPEVYFVENRNDTLDDSDSGLRFQELALSARAGPVEVTAGRMPLWWGPGRHGSLLLTDNARPFDLVRIATADRILLPSFLAYLGLIRAEVFATRLEGTRPVPHPWLAGMRVSTRLAPWVEIGASRTALFGGEGKSVTGQTILDVITARGENTPEGPGDQKASIDARILLPFPWQPLEIYGEYGGEDEAGGFFSNVAYVAGVYLPRVGPLRWLEAWVELADTSIAGERGTWYASDDYPAGYTYHDYLIGHHAGTDAFDFWAAVAVSPCPDWRIEIAYDFEEHQKLSPVTERLHQLRFAVRKRIGERFEVSLFAEHDRWRNFGQVFGEDATGTAVGVALRWTY